MLMMTTIFFFNDTATTEIYTLSLHDALPIYAISGLTQQVSVFERREVLLMTEPQQNTETTSEETSTGVGLDRKSTRLNSSHANISYVVFCLKKKIRLILYLSFEHVSTTFPKF